MTIHNSTLSAGDRVKLPVHQASPNTTYHTGTIVVEKNNAARVHWDIVDNPNGVPKHFGTELDAANSKWNYGLVKL